MTKQRSVSIASRVKYTKDSQYDLTAEDLIELIRMAGTHDIYDAIYTAFDFGYVRGHQATQAGKYRES